MKLLRLKITDPVGFRSLQCGFEHKFRTEWILQDKLAKSEGFAPFVCAGPNGSGKSNVLEALGAIFFQLEIQRVRRNFLPKVLQSADMDFSPVAFELDYLIKLPKEYVRQGSPTLAKVCLVKEPGSSIRFDWEDSNIFNTDIYQDQSVYIMDLLAPTYVLAYSSGENQILSLPFFKLRFLQFDEYWDALTRQLPYPGYPETRLAYLDEGFSQAILLCNLLFQDDVTLQPFREDVGITSLTEFRIIIRRSIPLSTEQLIAFTNDDENQHQSFEDIVKGNPALYEETDERGVMGYRVNLMQLLEGDKKSSLMVSALKRCATLSYVDGATDTLILDYWVNDATKKSFRTNFETPDGSPLALFQAFQVLLSLNLYPVTDALKNDLYQSSSHYVSESVPTLASDQRIMRFDSVRFRKRGVAKPVMLKELSDGEHQLLHSLGLCLLFRNTNSLFLLDEPETHLNPDWRANFISRLRQCLPGEGEFAQEMLITTHSPFLISDSKPGKVLVFEKDKTTGNISITHPDYNTLGASINLITMDTFQKRETIGRRASQMLHDLLLDPAYQRDPRALVSRIMEVVGDSIERTIAVQSVLARDSHHSSRSTQD